MGSVGSFPRIRNSIDRALLRCDMQQIYRTTIILDEQSRAAARQLALRFDCSTSEAIRRAILCCRDQVFGVPVGTRRQRTRALLSLLLSFLKRGS